MFQQKRQVGMGHKNQIGKLCQFRRDLRIQKEKTAHWLNAALLDTHQMVRVSPNLSLPISLPEPDFCAERQLKIESLLRFAHPVAL